MGNRRTARTRTSENTSTSNPADAREVVRFALDGIGYKVDLTPEEAAALRGVLSEYAGKGRRARLRTRTDPAASTASPTRSRDEARRIRLWAEERGLTVGPRGRLPQSVVDAWDKR